MFKAFAQMQSQICGSFSKSPVRFTRAQRITCYRLIYKYHVRIRPKNNGQTMNRISYAFIQLMIIFPMAGVLGTQFQWFTPPSTTGKTGAYISNYLGKPQKNKLLFLVARPSNAVLYLFLLLFIIRFQSWAFKPGLTGTRVYTFHTPLVSQRIIYVAMVTSAPWK